VPALGVPDIRDLDVVVLAPEERHDRAGHPLAEHVLRGDLTLALGHDPVLDAQLLPRVAIGPTRDVARRKHAGRARLEEFVDEHAAIARDAGLLRYLDARRHADAGDDR